MIKDYSEIPCDVKLINNTEDDILIRLGYIIDDIVFHNKETIVHIENSDLYAALIKRAEELGLETEVVTPGPVPPPTPTITTIEVGRTYKFTFKETIPEFDDPDFYTEVAQRLQGNAILNSVDISDNTIGIMDWMDFFMAMYGTEEDKYLYNPEVSGWTSSGGEPVVPEPLTFKVEGLLSKGESTTSLELEEMGLLFSNIEEVI